MDEIWKEIPGYDGKYFLVGYNKVYSEYKKGYLKIHRKKRGHLYVEMYIDKYKRKQFFLHRIVAMIYVPIPERLKDIPIEELDVHHDNFDPTDNRPENLRWLTKAEHMKIHHSIPVFRYGLDGLFIDGWESASDAAHQLRLNAPNILSCCKGNRNECGGFQWSFEICDKINGIDERYERTMNNRNGKNARKKVVELSISGKKIEIHKSISDAARKVNGVISCISLCCNHKQETAYERKWMFYDEWANQYEPEAS